jgi:hypothetical protein
LVRFILAAALTSFSAKPGDVGNLKGKNKNYVGGLHYKLLQNVWQEAEYNFDGCTVICGVLNLLGYEDVIGCTVICETLNLLGHQELAFSSYVLQ